MTRPTGADEVTTLAHANTAALLIDLATRGFTIDAGALDRAGWRAAS